MKVISDEEFNYTMKKYRDRLALYRPKGKDRTHAEMRMIESLNMNLEEAANESKKIRNEKKKFEESHIPESLDNFSSNVYNLIEATGLSVRSLEESLNIANGSIRNWKTSAPSVDKVYSLAKLFDVSMDSLFESPESEQQEIDDLEISLKSKSTQWVINGHKLNKAEISHLIDTAKHYRKPINKED